MTTMHGESTVVPNRSQLEGELRSLRERLADAWWNEYPLQEIQQIELQIAECKQQLRQAVEAVN